MTTRHPRPRRGFTLVEMVAALVVLSVLAAIVGPSFSALRGVSLDETARVELHTYARTARDLHSLKRSWQQASTDVRTEMPLAGNWTLTWDLDQVSTRHGDVVAGTDQVPPAGGGVNQEITGWAMLADTGTCVYARTVDGGVPVSWTRAAPCEPTARRAIDGPGSNPPPVVSVDAPTLTGIGEGDTELTASFTPAVTGDIATSFTATATAAGQPTRTVVGAASPLTITGLTNGVTYTVTVTGSRQGVVSVPSNALEGTPHAVPLRANITSVTPGDRSFTVVWSATTTPDAPIDGFRLYVNGVFVGSYPAETTTATVNDADVPGGLANGTNYTVQVVAYNSDLGQGAASAPANVTPRTTPDAPTLLDAVPGDTSVSVEFAAPGSAAGSSVRTRATVGARADGGAAITGYIVTATAAGATTRTATGASSPIVVQNLTNGVEYTISVRAVNAAGAGTPSSTLTVTPAVVAARVTLLASSAGDRSIALAWSGRSSISFPFSGYHVKVNGAVAATVPATTSSITLTTADVPGGLTNGTSYAVQVVAFNQTGDGPTSTQVDLTPATTPGAPTIQTATFIDGDLALTWSAPADDGGFTVASYSVVATAAEGSVRQRSVTTASAHHTFPGLDDRVAYTATVRACSSFGCGPAATITVDGALGATAPHISSISGGDETIELTWDAPLFGSADGYRVYVNGSPVLFLDPTTATATVTAADVTGGLTNGASYAVQIGAWVYGAGETLSATRHVTPFTTPDAPTITGTTATSTTATVSFSAPGFDGGSALIGYTVTATAAGRATRTASGAGSPITVTGLDNAVAYTIAVVARNAAGDSPTSGAVTVTTGNVAVVTPTIGLVTPADRAFTVGFSATGEDAATVTSYKVYVDGIAVKTIDAPATSVAVAANDVPSGLTNGTTYTVRVGAVNEAGEGLSAPATVTPRTTPGVPVITLATAGNAAITVTFTAPTSDGGEPIDNYTVTASSPVAGGRTVLAASAGTVTVSGLDNGETYTVSVAAINDAGTGPAATQAGLVPLAPPAAPVITALTPGNAAFDVSWSHTATPVDTPDGFRIYVDGVPVATIDAVTFTTTVTTADVAGGLVNGTGYSVQVAAYNDEAGENMSNAASVTPRTVPGAPTLVDAIAGNGEAVVSFTAPASNGGATITDYTVTATAPGRADVRQTGGASPITIDGLTNAVTWTITVAAVNAAGTGAASNSTTVTPQHAPYAPVVTSVVDGDRTSTITWTAAADATHPIDELRIYVDGILVRTLATSATTATFGVADGLTNGGQYATVVRAYHHVGGETSSNTVTMAPYTTPDAPVITGHVAGDSQVTVDFTAPGFDGGRTITGYTLTASAAGQPTRTVTGSASPLVVTQLTNGVTYTLELVATNAAGPSPAATTSAAPASVPDQIEITSLTPADRSFTVAWTSGATVARPVTGYRIYVDGVYVKTIAAPSTSATVSSAELTGGLTNGTSYSVQVAAYHTTTGEGLLSDAWTVTPATAPGAPTITAATAGDARIDVTFTAPSSDGGAAITGYTATATAAGHTTRTATGGAGTLAITGLDNGVTYTVSVTATNAAGSTTSAATTATPYGTPARPTVGVVTAGDESFTVSWSATATSSNPIDGYHVYVGGALVATVPSATTSTTITSADVPGGLVNGTTYSVQVASYNATAGESVSVAKTVTPVAVPDAPTLEAVTAGDGQLAVAFTAPADNGGSAITGYTLTATAVGYTTRTATGTSSPLTLTGLTNGVAYTLALVATNAVGDSSAATTSATPYGAPGVVTMTSLTSADASFSVAWSATANDGAPITGYRVYVNGNQVKSFPANAVSGTITSADVSGGLVNGTTYSVTVAAYSSYGTTHSAAQNVTIGVLTTAAAPVEYNLGDTTATALPNNDIFQTFGNGFSTTYPGTWSNPVLTGGTVTVTASSNASTAWRATDHDTSTNWAASTGNGGQWVQWDFGANRSVVPQGLLTRWAYPTWDTYLEGSNDGTNWTAIWKRDVTGSTLGARYDTVRWANEEAYRYLRVIKRGTTTSAWLIYDIQIFGKVNLFAAPGVWAQTAYTETVPVFSSPVQVGQYIYFPGGDLGGATRTRTTGHVRFDMATETFSSLAAVPVGNTVASAAVYDNKIYRLGGVDGSDVATSDLYIYDIATDTWRTVAGKGLARYGMTTAVVGSTLYAWGGRNGPGTTTYNTGFKMDLSQPDASLTWVAVANTPWAWAFSTQVVIGSDIYVFNSFNTSVAPQQTTYKYSTTANTWTQLSSPNNTAGVRAALVLPGNRIVFAGGMTYGWVGTSYADIWNPSAAYGTLQWGGLRHLNTARATSGIGIYNGTIYVVGGANGSGTITPVASFEKRTAP